VSISSPHSILPLEPSRRFRETAPIRTSILTRAPQILALVDAAGRQGLRWTAAVKSLDNQATVPVDHAEFAEVIKGLVDEGVVKVVGERERRTIRRLAD
jgi:hypothetical protein